ncbi:hypothetical protein ACFQYP_33515 [Nonomuraea antimicrobica]|uniref:hypothetical protein n=1 Tax=Nonomuraea antimicrobica TaxID=561173 RepID=UPI0031EFE60C
MTAATIIDYDGLSCYTANLAAYLDGEFDAADLISRSVRSAARTDLPPPLLAFSHHRVRLERLPDGSRLRYRHASSAADALRAVADQLHQFGRVLILVDNRRLPWSPALPAGPSAPHWLLVDGAEGGDWRVRDEFAGLLPDGRQRPFAGRFSSSRLAEAMETPEWNEQQRMRNRLACGFPLAGADVPGWWWLERTREPRPAQRSAEETEALPGRWLEGERSALTFLGDRLARSAESAALHLDDCWALAGHHRFALRHRLTAAAPGDPARPMLAAAAERWAALPRLLRYAVESAARGRPRPGIIRRAFADALAAQLALGQTDADQPFPGDQT